MLICGSCGCLVNKGELYQGTRYRTGGSVQCRLQAACCGVSVHSVLCMFICTILASKMLLLPAEILVVILP
jgi:hypothetical protein